MKKRSCIWLRSIASSCILLLILPAVLFAASQADLDAAKASAGKLGDMVKGFVGSTSGITDRFSTPATSSNASMSTMDGSTTFNGQLMCPSTSKFLDIYFGIGAKGDLSPLIVSQDTDLDGNYDFVFTSPVIVSGICANGVVSCTEGTWSGCSYYKWQADANSKLSFAPAGMTELGGCSCLNSSCAKPTWNVFATEVLKALGGGASGAIMQSNSGFTIANAVVDGTEITYYANYTGNCSGGNTSAKSFTQYNSKSALESGTNSAVATQATDSGSYYSRLDNSTPNKNTTNSLFPCVVEWVHDVTTNQKSLTGSGSGTMCVPYNMNMSLSVSGGAYSVTGFASSVKSGDCGSAMPTVLDYPGTLEAGAFVTGLNICGSSPECTSTGCKSASSGSAGGALIQCPSVASTRAVNYSFNWDLDYKVDVESEYLRNTCQTAEANCTLKDEKIDGIATYSSFQPTGLYPVGSSCNDFTSSIGNIYHVCKEWWKKERTYLCPETTLDIDVSAGTTRAKSIYETVAQGAGEITYTDVRKESSGTWTAVNDKIIFPDQDPGACEITCKTKVPSVDANAGGGANVSQANSSFPKSEFRYRPCVNNVCPLLEPDETIVENCGCLSDFVEAAKGMEMINTAAKDMICSSGVKK